MRHPTVLNINVGNLAGHEYDYDLFALGYESRGVSFLSDLANKPKKRIAFGFNHGVGGAYAKNKELFLKNNTEIIEGVSDSNFDAQLQSAISQLPQDGCKFFVDISCFSRFRLAAIVSYFFKLSDQISGSISVDFFYTIAKFSPPDISLKPNTIIGPAHSSFAGWSVGRSSSTVAIVGLGYEQDQALGVVEYLQAGEVWAFTPVSPIVAFEKSVISANKLLMEEIQSHHLIDYDVTQPKAVINSLESVIRGLDSNNGVVLIPFGPKIFVLACLIVASMRKNVAVWRVSQGPTIEPKDSKASKVKVGMRMIFQ